MKPSTLRKILILIAAALVLLALGGCKSESSPTAPPTTTTTPPGGGVSPPTGATVALSVSNATPLVSSRVTVTATVTVNGSPAVDGTAVQFTTSIGTFSDSGQNTTIRTTANGVATAILTSASAGTATITATVNNVSKTTQVTFSTAPPIPVPPNTTPTITAVTPATGLPTGGQQVTITGTNFRAPVRVFFDPGNGQTPKEAFVVSVTPTQIVVVSPAFDITTGQTLPVTIKVVDEAGTANEQSATSANAFTYQLAILTPAIRAVSPTSGPIDGGTRVTIIGDAFQAPVQVFFNSAEAQVISVTFNQIIVISPTARDTSTGGSGVVTGPVDIRVLNVASGKSVTSAAAFRYVAKMQITALGPTEGPFTGGTRIKIDGVGFNDPVTVSVAGVAAQVISVSGTEIIAITSGVHVTTCADVPGPLVVTNIDNGDQASGPTFTYRILKPVITNIGTGNLNGTTTVTVANATGTPRITLGTEKAIAPITGTTQNANGTTTFTIQIPPTLTLQTQACAGGGTAQTPTGFDVTFTSLETGCTDTAPKGLFVNPTPGPVLTVAGSFTPFSGVITPGSAGPPVTPTTVAVSPSTETVSIVNTGNTTPLTVSSLTTTSVGGANGCSAFNISATPPAPTTLNQCDVFAISASYKGQLTPTASPDQCTITVVTSAGTRTFTVSGSTR